MDRTVEQSFKNFHVGKHYEQFKILLVGNVGMSSEKFTSFIRKNFSSILKAFDLAAKAHGINLGDSDRADYFAYFGNDCKKDLPRVIHELDAKIVLTSEKIPGVEENFAAIGDETIPAKNARTIFIDTSRHLDIFKNLVFARVGIGPSIQLPPKTLRDAAINGSSMLDALDKFLDETKDGDRNFNFYPSDEPPDDDGKKKRLIAICEEPTELKEVVDYIQKWLGEQTLFVEHIREWLGERILLFTDKWLPEIVEPLRMYKSEIKYLTDKPDFESVKLYRHFFPIDCFLKYSFWLTTDEGAVLIPFFVIGFKDSVTRFKDSKRNKSEARGFWFDKVVLTNICYGCVEGGWDSVKRDTESQFVLDEITKKLKRVIIYRGHSPLEVFDNVCAGVKPSFNTFPMGTPTNELFPELITICENPQTLEEVFAHIHDWLKRTEVKNFPQRLIVLFTDKWIPETYTRYQKAFRRFKARNVTFDFILYTDIGSVKIPVLRK